MNEKKNKLFTNTLFVSLAAILCCALWGSATPFIKLGYQLIRPEATVASTILFAGIRFMLAGIITILIYSVARRKFLYPQKENISKVLKISCFQTIIQYVFLRVALSLKCMSNHLEFFFLIISEGRNCWKDRI